MRGRYRVSDLELRKSLIDAKMVLVLSGQP